MVALAVALAGCARFQLESVPDEAPRGPAARCEEDSPLTLIDASVAVSLYAIGISGLVALLGADLEEDSAAAWAGAGGVIGAVFTGAGFGWSSGWGEDQLTRCARVKRGLPP